MIIEVGTKPLDSTKHKGDLLEQLTEHLLRAQNYEVETRVRKTGVELDLLCRHKANSNKTLYVECKAYRDGKNIDSNIIYNLIGKKTQKKYEEAWLVATCDFGKDAKGVVDELTSDGTVDLSFYTPNRLIEALIDARVIVSHVVANHAISKLLIGHPVNEPTLLVAAEGYFWCYRNRAGGKDTGVLVVNATSGESVTDYNILSELSKVESSFSGLDFQHIFSTETSSSTSPFRFRLDEDYLRSIKDTGVMYTHPNKRSLDKDDLFIFPDLQLINEDSKISSSKLMAGSHDNSKNIIFGDELSGKTTLAQKLQRSYAEAGYVPVYLNACNINSSDLQKFYRTVCRCIKVQYSNATDPVINSISKKDIVLFIDDFQSAKLNKESASSLVLAIDKQYERVTYLINTRQELEILANNKLSTLLAEYNLYRIKELGFKLRDDMIRTWISIGRNESILDEDRHKNIVEIAEVINSTVGRNYVPTYPIYVLTILQSFEASTVKSLQGSAYAEFYNYLVTHALGSSGVKAADLDLYYSFLSELSYHFFVASEKDISEGRFRAFYEEFCRRKMLEIRYERTKQILLQSKILKSENEFYWFNHSYIYYFFVGKYLSENANKADVRGKILALTNRLYLAEFANIVIFLVHFSKDQFVLDNILAEARKIFADREIVTFSKDQFANINKLVEKELSIILEDRRPEETRADQLELKDELNDKIPKESTEENDYTSDIKKLDVFGQINLAFKIIEILGQIAKNYYGSLDGDVKIALLEETYNLGLRSLNRLMTAFDEYTGILQKEICKVIAVKKLVSETEVEAFGKRLIFEFATMISFAFIAKVANSVASKELSAIYEAVYLKDEQISKRLINVAVELDFYNGLDAQKLAKLNGDIRNNNIATMMLRLLVTRHLYKFNIPYDKKQKVCEKLNIGIESQVKMLATKK